MDEKTQEENRERLLKLLEERIKESEVARDKRITKIHRIAEKCVDLEEQIKKRAKVREVKLKQKKRSRQVKPSRARRK